MDSLIGQTLLHYRILDTLGEGGMGEVYLAVDEKLGRRVALKTLPQDLADDPVRRKRFERESTVLANLNHPFIVTVHAVEEVDGKAFLVMELVEGDTLGKRIPREGMAEEEALEIAIPMTEAVAAAHRAGVIHRDIKPDNVMIREDGLVKVVDFGLSRLEPMTLADGLERPVSDRLTVEGKVVGTVHYMSPEQLEGRSIGPASDVFSLGIVLYEMITGVRPFHGVNPVSIASSILRDDPEWPEPSPAGSSGLRAVIERCLDKDPRLRYQHAGEVHGALVAVRDDARREAWQATSEAAVPKDRWKGWPLLLGGLAIVALVAAAAWLGIVGRGELDEPVIAEADTEGGGGAVTEEGTVSPAAADAYARGRYFLAQRTREGFDKAMEKFRQALVLDPEYAEAHAGIAHAYNLMASYKLLPAEEGFRRAREAAEAALRLDPEAAGAHAALAFIEHYWEWDLAEAETGFRHALEVDPDDPEVHNWLALVLIHTARFDEAVEHALTAARLAPLSLVAHRNAATVLYFARDLERAEVYLEKLRELEPDFSNLHILQGAIYELEGRFEDAEAEYLAEKALDRGWNAIVDSLLGCLYARTDRRAEALAIAERQSAGGLERGSPFYVAALWNTLGDRDRAFEWLDRAYDERDRFLLQLRAEPRFDDLRSDPRYLNFLRKVGLLVD